MYLFGFGFPWLMARKVDEYAGGHLMKVKESHHY